MPTVAGPSEKERWGIDGFSVGIALGGVGSHEQWSQTLEWVDFAEARSFHSVWLPEMHFVRGSCSTPLLNLSAIAARTQKLRLATTSLLLASGSASAESESVRPDRPTLVKIRATWCGTCQRIEGTWEQLKTTYGDSANFVVFDVTDKD